MSECDLISADGTVATIVRGKVVVDHGKLAGALVLAHVNLHGAYFKRVRSDHAVPANVSQ
jgi:hypothetical protein